MMNPVICTLATESAYKDLKVFLFTLGLYNTPQPHVYILGDDFIKANMPAYKGTLECLSSLQVYSGKTRKQMEQRAGSEYRTQWEDFMMEKASVLSWAFSKGASSAYFLDCDICFLGPLVHPSSPYRLAVSPHHIQPHNEARYGVYNAGYVWTSDPEMPDKWRIAAKSSRYYDQAALEDLVEQYKDTTYMLPIQTNYGWWRMFQGTVSSSEIQKGWTLFRNESFKNSGIRVNGSALLSIHTHWGEKSDLQTIQFNTFLMNKLKLLSKYQSTGQLVNFLKQEFS